MNQADYERQVAERAARLAEALAADTGSLWSVHAALLLDSGRDPASALLQEQFGRVGAGPFARNAAGTFDLLAAMSLVCRWSQRLAPEAVAHVRRVFTEGVLHRGNTENHWLMHYVGNLLAAERWGDAPRWWNGLPPAAMRAEATRWIRGTIDRTARFGHHEYDSPQYHPWHLLPMIALADHAADADLRRLAGQTACLLVADMALEYFRGSWAGGHAREGYRENTWTRSGSVASLQYLYLGGEAFDPAVHKHGLAGIAVSARWRPPALLAALAHDGEPRVVRKTKAPREILRHAPGRSRPVRKYTFLSRSFALGSSQLGLPGAPAGPIDLVSWDLTWSGPKHSAKIAATHPYRSPRRFSAFLGGLPHALGRSVAAPKPYLQSPDRLFGATPYERMVQHEGAILALYRIPADDENPYVNLFLPKTAAWVEADGWLCADLGGFAAGVRPIGAYRWDVIGEDDYIDGWLLRIDDRCGGLALEAVEVQDAGGFDAFVEARTAAGLDLAAWPDPGRATLRTTAGHTLEIDWPDGGPDVHRVDGRVIDYDSWPLYCAPGVEAPLGTGRVRFERGGERLDLDFGVDPAAEPLPMRVIG